MKTSFWKHTLAALTLTSVLASPDTLLVAAEPAATPTRPAIAPVEAKPVTSGKASTKLQAKLESIILDEVRFDSLPLSEVVEILIKEALKRDPEKIGVNFLMGRPTGVPPPSPIDPATGIPSASVPDIDLNSVAIRILPPLRKIRLIDALDAITRVAEVPITYTVEDYAVVWTVDRDQAVPPPVPPVPPAAPAPPTVPAPIAPPVASVELHTRWFKIDPNTFAAGLREMLGEKAQPTNAASVSQVAEDTRTLLASHGVEWTSAKSIFYNDRQGTLMVRATLRDLNIVELFVQILNTAPAQVSIEVKFCEVAAEATKALGFDWLTANPAGQGLPRPPNASDFTLTGILTDPQFRDVQRALEQQTGVNVLTLPKVTTLSARPAQIKAVEIRSIVTGLDRSTNNKPDAAKQGSVAGFQPVVEKFELGPILDLIPYVSADGFTIQLTILASLKEFVGYDRSVPLRLTPEEVKNIFGETTRPNDPYPLPIFRHRQLTSSAVVWDGQTLVLSGGSVPAQPKVNAKGTPDLAPSGKTLLVFITPTIIDPAGNRVHSSADLPFAKDAVPSQKAAQKK